MKKESVFSTHSAAITALYILGNAIIYLPVKNSDAYTFFGYIAVAVFSVLISFAVIPVANAVFGCNILQKTKNSKKMLFLIFFFASAVYAAFCAADAFKDFLRFVSEIILPDSSYSFIIIIFLLTAVFFATRRQEDILKFAVLGFFMCFLLIVFFFFGAAHNYNPRNIFIFTLPDVKNFVFQAKPYFKNLLSAVLLMPVYHSLVFKRAKKSALISGAATGYILLGFCILSPLLLFGTDLSGRLDYPFASAVSTVTVGRIFTRMDGFSYIIYFVTSIIKITVSVYIVRKCLEKINVFLS